MTALARTGSRREFPPNRLPFDSQVVRIRRVYLFRVLLSRREALTYRELDWIVGHSDGPLSGRYLGSDLATLVDLGLVSRRSGFGLVPDYAPTLSARRNVKP
jgi:hypothetical protein